MGDWDQQASDSELQKNTKTITDTLAVLSNYQELASKGIASGETSLAQAQQTIADALANIQAETARRHSLARDFIDDNQQNAGASDLGQQIRTLTPKVEQQKTLYQLRTEQAAALAEKILEQRLFVVVATVVPDRAVEASARHDARPRLRVRGGVAGRRVFCERENQFDAGLLPSGRPSQK